MVAPRWRRRRPAAVDIPPLAPRLQLLRLALVMLALVAGHLALHLAFVGRLQHASAQARSLASFRRAIAEGTAPTGPADGSGRPLRAGTPVAHLEIPRLGLREVVGEGTAGGELMSGPGHRRDSPLPGEAGTSVVMGRQATYGGPFADLGSLRPGDPVIVTTGHGTARFTVRSVRYGGEPTPPPPAAGRGRLLLIAASGPRFLPSAVVRVDADMTGPAVAGGTPLFSAATLPRAERVMGADASTMWALVLWLQALTAVAAGVVWAWQRWGALTTWITCFPLSLLVALAASSEAFRLLPNLL